MSSCFHDFWWEVWCIYYLILPYVMYLFPAGCLQDHLLYFIYSGLNIKCLGVVLWYLFYFMFSHLLGLVCISVNNIRKLSSNSSTTPFSLFSFWNSNYASIYTIWYYPTALVCSMVFDFLIPQLFVLSVSICVICCLLFKFTNSFLGCIKSIDEPMKHILHLY